MKRVIAGEIHISPSDKGKGLVVMPVDMYHKMCRTLLENDVKVEWKELEDSQREIWAHARALARITRLGEAGGSRNNARCFDSLSSWACDPPS